MKPPVGGGAGRVVEEFATSLDIAPTVLTAARLNVPAVLAGHPLPLDGGAPPARTTGFAEEDLEGNVLQAARTHEWKLITPNPEHPPGLPPAAPVQLGRAPRGHPDL